MFSLLLLLLLLLFSLTCRDCEAASFDERQAQRKVERGNRLVSLASQMKVPSYFVPSPTSPKINPQGPVIVFAALGDSFSLEQAVGCVGSLKATDYDGDIVVLVTPNSKKDFLFALEQFNVIVFKVSETCTGKNHDVICDAGIGDGTPMLPRAMLRQYYYLWLTRHYKADAQFMISDFRDVMFQSNPFKYHPEQWSPEDAQLVVFQEFYPIKVIKRCVFNYGWIYSCYQEKAKLVEHNVVSCSGIVLGTIRGLTIYSFLMTKQVDPRVRYGLNTTNTNKFESHNCISLGMDQGFHNWLLYSGQLQKFMDVKVFAQGDGPVNTVGCFAGTFAVPKFTLAEWQILKGENNSKYFYNWNGDKSPVVHQFDRHFKELGGDYAVLAVRQYTNKEIMPKMEAAAKEASLK